MGLSCTSKNCKTLFTLQTVYTYKTATKSIARIKTKEYNPKKKESKKRVDIYHTQAIAKHINKARKNANHYHLYSGFKDRGDSHTLLVCTIVQETIGTNIQTSIARKQNPSRKKN